MTKMILRKATTLPLNIKPYKRKGAGSCTDNDRDHLIVYVAIY